MDIQEAIEFLKDIKEFRKVVLRYTVDQKKPPGEQTDKRMNKNRMVASQLTGLPPFLQFLKTELE